MLLIVGLLVFAVLYAALTFADTALASGHALAPKVISEQLFRQALRQMWFSRFIGNTENDIIQRKMQLGKGKGDSIYFGLRMKLEGLGQVDDDTLEGNEEAMTFYDWSTTIHQRRHAVRTEGAMTEQRSIWDLRSEARRGLEDWTAETMDMDMCLALSGVANPVLSDAAVPPSIVTGNTRIFYGGQTLASGVIESVANDAAIDSATANLFGVHLLSMLRRKAMMVTPKVRPIKIKEGRFKGKSVYVALLHPYQIKALRQDPDWKNPMYYAEVKGEDNPLFSGAEFIWDNVVVQEYEGILTRLGANGTDPTEYFDTRSGSPDVCANTINVARGLFLGAQAGVQAWGQKPDWVEERFDYGSKLGVATKFIYRAAKPVFNANDFGVIACDTAIVPD